MDFPAIVTLAIPFFIGALGLEVLLWRLTGKGNFETRDTAASLCMGFGNSLIGLGTGIIIYGAYSFVHQFALVDIGFQWWAFVLCFFAEDFAYYWFHRISHERRFFWASHVVHHSSQHYNLSTALRQTWTSVLSITFIFWLPLVLIGFPPEMVLLFQGISLVYQFWIHTEMIGRLGVAEWVFNTPSHHRVHHATNPQYLDRNYAGVLIIWDRLFGTFVPEDTSDPPHYGIIQNLRSFNPFKIAFAEWLGLCRDVVRASSASDALRFVFSAPGWTPDGSRRTSASIRETWHQYQTGAGASSGVSSRGAAPGNASVSGGNQP